jgi:hypothetical protein
MKDFAGKEFEVGQAVALCLPRYKHLVKGRVEKIGKAMVTCSYYSGKYPEYTSRYPNQVVILGEENS